METEKVSDLHQRILESAGMKFVNELHKRSFSLNIFKMNAIALIEATLNVRDTDSGISLLSQDNREAGQQAHREIGRHLHNFTASAMTLVDHTRVFMRKQYEGTTVFQEYSSNIAKSFANDPVSQFVQGLRNYMVHRGLPNSQMFFDMRRDENGAPTVETGVRLDSDSLLEWDGWKNPARQYIETAGKSLNIHEFTEEYLTHIDRFHQQLEDDLKRFHDADLRDLEVMQSQYQKNLQMPSLVSDLPLDCGEIVTDNKRIEESHSDIILSALREIIAPISEAIQEKIRPLSFKSRGRDFPSERVVGVSLDEADIIDAPVFRGPDASDVRVVAYIFDGEQAFGIEEDDYQLVDQLIDAVLQKRWASERFGHKFIEDEFLAWSRQKFADPDVGDFAHALLKSADEKVKPWEVWAPIAHLEVEAPFTFGPVEIRPITADMMTNLEKNALKHAGDFATQIAELFQRLKSELQGWAAAVVSAEAEAALAEEIGLLIAQDAVCILRFFSPGAALMSVLCPTALIGSEVIPKSTALLIEGDVLSSTTDRTLSAHVAHWQLRVGDLRRLEKTGLALAGALVSPENLDDFESMVRSSLITYSKGTTFSDPLDRLAHALAAVEGVLLRHSMEPIEFNIAERMSFILSKVKGERDEITKNARQAYRLRTRHRATPLTPAEIEALSVFVSYAHTVLSVALNNTPNFESRADFVTAVDRMSRPD